MTREVFDNPDIGVMYHKLHAAQAANFASFKDCLTEIQVEFGKVSQRLSYSEEAVKELRAADSIILEMARNLTGQHQQTVDMRDTLKQLLTKVDMLVQGQASLDNARTAMLREMDTLSTQVADLRKAEERVDEYLTTIKATVRTLSWVVTAVAGVTLSLAAWFGNIVMDDHKFIMENRKAIEQLDRRVNQQ